MKKEVRLGLLCFAGSLLIKQYFAVPEFVMGILLGLSLCLLLIGALPEPAYRAVKRLKHTLISPKNQKTGCR